MARLPEPSALHWDGSCLTVRIDEVGMPVPRRIRGTVKLHPAAMPGQSFAIDPSGRHHWTPVAPIARVEVALDTPALHWSGAGYWDMNAGTAPLELPKLTINPRTERQSSEPVQVSLPIES